MIISGMLMNTGKWGKVDNKSMNNLVKRFRTFYPSGDFHARKLGEEMVLLFTDKKIKLSCKEEDFGILFPGQYIRSCSLFKQPKLTHFLIQTTLDYYSYEKIFLKRKHPVILYAFHVEGGMFQGVPQKDGSIFFTRLYKTPNYN